MNYHHLTHCSSTQTHLIEKLTQQEFSPTENHLVSTDWQINGKGRGLNTWDFYKGSIAFSFNMDLATIATLTSAEVSILLLKFLENKTKREFFLKWPNDLLNSRGEKCAGILLNTFSQQQHIKVVVGIGINYFARTDSLNLDYPYPANSIYSIPPDENNCNFTQEIPKEICQFIVNNRYTPEETLQFWNLKCFHIKKNVAISEGNKKSIGKFLGIGKNGQAQLQIEQEGNNQIYLQEFYSGNLSII